MVVTHDPLQILQFRDKIMVNGHLVRISFTSFAQFIVFHNPAYGESEVTECQTQAVMSAKRIKVKVKK